jgi:hypothetical protein
MVSGKNKFIQKKKKKLNRKRYEDNFAIGSKIWGNLGRNRIED